jgi:Tfp pilus assembly major pilin PilA
MLFLRVSPHIKRARVRSRVRGFVLAELAIAVVIAGVMIVSGIAYYKRQLQSDTAHALAEQYKTVNNAVSTYMVNHWPVLVDTPQICGNSTWLVGAAPVDPGTACNKTIGVTPVVNALQPTMAELFKLGYLPQGQAGPLLLPDATDVRQFNGTAAPHTFGVRIEVVCTNTPPPITNLLNCPDVTKGRDLRSVVFNARPYANIDNQLFNILGEALNVLPNDAGMSVPMGANAVPLDLVGRARAGAVDLSVGLYVNIPNPVQVSGAAGQAGILGVRGGYGSSGFQQFTRRDGGAKPTASWDFDAKNLTNVQNFDAKEISAIDAIKINNVNNVGDPCNPSKQSIATSNLLKTLLVCDGGTSQWVRSVTPGVDPNNTIVSRDVIIPAKTDGNADITDSGGKPISTVDWGMPALTHIVTNGDFVTDTNTNSYCGRVDTNSVKATTDMNGKPLPPLARYDYYPCKDFVVETNYTSKTSYAANALNIEIKKGASGQWILVYANNNNDNSQLVGVTFYKINK